jgi:hypothetical protein
VGSPLRNHAGFSEGIFNGDFDKAFAFEVGEKGIVDVLPPWQNDVSTVAGEGGLPVGIAGEADV